MKTIRFSKRRVPQLAADLAKRVGPGTIVAFVGPLGAGKTTLIKCLLARLGVQEEVTSPTFAYVNTYVGAGGMTIHHFDLYRLSSLDEFLQAGFDEYLTDPAAVTVIEWPEVIFPWLSVVALQERVVCCRLRYDPENMHERIIEISGLVNLSK